MKAFQTISRDNLRLLLIGSFDNEIRDQAHALLAKSKNILYLGWKEANELMEYLCAADVYLQPGSQSAIMQNSLCLRCPVILEDVPSHRPFIQGNGWLLNDDLTLGPVFESISNNPVQLRLMSEASQAIARKMLDYRVLAARLYQ